MGLNNYQTILGIELNNGMCYSRHHLIVPGHFYCWVAGFFKLHSAELTFEIVYTFSYSLGICDGRIAYIVKAELKS